MTKAVYPPSRKMTKFFGQKFLRLMFKVCLAQELGCEGLALLSLISSGEDATGYRRGITYFDGQMLPLLGCRSEKVLATIRKKCIDAGWLHYEHGRKGVPGRYWVMIPDYAAGLDDAPTDEGHDQAETDRIGEESGVETASQSSRNGDETASQRRRNGVTTVENRERTGREPVENRSAIGQTFLPIPIPVPIQNSLHAIGGDDLTFLQDTSKEFDRWWNSYPGESRTGRRACWNLWPKILVEIQAKIRCSETEAATHLIQKTALFANSPRGKDAEFRWSAETFLRDGHYDDAVSSWEITHGKRRGKKKKDIFGGLREFVGADAEQDDAV